MVCVKRIVKQPAKQKIPPAPFAGVPGDLQQHRGRDRHWPAVRIGGAC